MKNPGVAASQRDCETASGDHFAEALKIRPSRHDPESRLSFWIPCFTRMENLLYVNHSLKKC
jgi:hypothetical protein